MNAAGDFFGGGALLFFTDMFLKSLAALVFAAAAAGLLRRRGLPAGARSGVWAVCFTVLLALPFLSLVRLNLPASGEHLLPGRYYRVPVSVLAREEKTASTSTPPPLPPAPRAPNPPPETPLFENSPPAAKNTGSASRARTLFWLWPLGTVLVLARTLAGLVLVRRLARQSDAPLADGPLAELLSECRRALNVTRPVTLRLSRGDVLRGIAVSPMTWGWRRPTILLPAHAARDWSPERVRAVLLHELAHVARNDWAAQVLLARTVCALYWFHPLVWLAAACFRAEAERACDESVLQAGMSAPEYAGHLLAVARLLRPANAAR